MITMITQKYNIKNGYKKLNENNNIIEILNISLSKAY